MERNFDFETVKRLAQALLDHGFKLNGPSTIGWRPLIPRDLDRAYWLAFKGYNFESRYFVGNTLANVVKLCSYYENAKKWEIAKFLICIGVRVGALIPPDNSNYFDGYLSRSQIANCRKVLYPDGVIRPFYADSEQLIKAAICSRPLLNQITWTILRLRALTNSVWSQIPNEIVLIIMSYFTDRNVWPEILNLETLAD